MAEDESVVHIVGPVVDFYGHQRQRCLWCGALILDQDLKMMAVQLNPDGSADPPGYWEVGAWVACDKGGHAWWTVEPDKEDPNKSPENACVRLDPFTTT